MRLIDIGDFAGIVVRSISFVKIQDDDHDLSLRSDGPIGLRRMSKGLGRIGKKKDDGRGSPRRRRGGMS
jgi:hypothetical protein